MFKPGDKVKRVVGSWQECKLGAICTVSHDDGHNNLTIVEHPYIMASDKFVLYEEDVPAEPAHLLFVKGDKIKRIAGVDGVNVKKGGIYTFVEYRQNKLGLKLLESATEWDSDKFVFVEHGAAAPEAPAPQFKVGDKVVRKHDKINGMFPDSAKVYVVIDLKPMADGQIKIKLSGIEGFWYAEKFALVAAAPANEIAVGMHVVIARANHTDVAYQFGELGWLGLQCEVVKVNPKIGNNQYVRLRRIDNGQVLKYVIEKRDLDIVDAEGYVPPPVRKIKVYNAERRAAA